jgi:isopentenyl-diphosphate delta-isomerase
VKILSDIMKRKGEHIKICLEKNVMAREVTSGFEDIKFVHRALPEIQKKDIDTSIVIFNHRFAAPLIVGALTGGTTEAEEINANIAEAVEELKLGMGVGSQRIAIEKPSLSKTFAITRQKAPTAFLLANLGAPQLVKGYGIREARKAVKMIDANALVIHLNPLQETIQPEGETNYRGVIKKIREIAQNLEVPVIIKETGAGIAKEEAKKLVAAGVKGIDISGVGGTSFAAVEYYRAEGAQNKFQQKLGENFWDWGIPTAAAIVEVSKTVQIPVIASGGIRNGIHIAKALALGASLTSVSTPILRSAVKGAEEVKETLSFFIKELKNTMFLVGVSSIKELKDAPVLVMGKTGEWLRLRGFDVEAYARR